MCFEIVKNIFVSGCFRGTLRIIIEIHITNFWTYTVPYAILPDFEKLFKEIENISTNIFNGLFSDFHFITNSKLIDNQCFLRTFSLRWTSVLSVMKTLNKAED